MRDSGAEVPLRIIVTAPPPGILYALQENRDPVAQTQSTGGDLAFELTLRVRRDPATGRVRFLGPYAQGPASGRFVYICLGTYAGDPVSRWGGRMKVPLAGLDWPSIERAAAEAGAVLEARVSGTGKDGRPACASVPLLGDGWVLVKPKRPAGSVRGVK